MPEMKNNFQRGRMNKDLDERLVPNGEYRDALNVELATSNDSDMGTLQTLKGNTFLGVGGAGGVCVGSIADDKNDKLYFMIAGDDRDRIIEYDYKNGEFLPVCIDWHSDTGLRALNFNADFLITGINIIDDLLFWTDNNSEPKKINITRGKLGCLFGSPQTPSYTNHTKLMVRNLLPSAPPNSYVAALDQSFDLLGNIIQSPIKIQEEHLTVIKKGPPTAPVLEMIDINKTLATGDWDGDGLIGGSEILSPVSLQPTTPSWVDADGEFLSSVQISTPSGTDFSAGDYLNIFTTTDRSINVRVLVTGGGGTGYTVEIQSGNKEISGETDLTVELQQADALFQFKFPRFAYRYKYEDGEYSCFSPFTEPAFIPSRFNFLPKEGYNLGMVNNLRKLAIKDFVHERSMGDDVISIDILYKESNSPNIYSVKTIKRTAYDSGKWDAWNGDSPVTVADTGIATADDIGWSGITKGYLPITTEMIHATLPANQLLRPWDNVPRKALAQEVIGNRLVYGNYLQNYDLKKGLGPPGPNNIKVDIKVQVQSTEVKNTPPEEMHAGNRIFLDYSPAKSVKTLRTYQLGVVYIDKYGRETPVFSEDKRGATSTEITSESSIYIRKELADKRNQLKVELKNNPPDWATHFKFFIKETSNEYYNLVMDRCYDAEDGNIWLSFPSAERNKVDEETFLILKKAHDSNKLISEPAKYKIIAIENEAPRFIKLKNISMGSIQDDKSIPVIGTATEGFPFENGTFILIRKQEFETVFGDPATGSNSLLNQNISQVFVRVKTPNSSSVWYRIKTVILTTSGTYYKIEVDKKFGTDMGITSVVAGDWTTRNTCSVEVVKRLPEDRAEFEGRFFVKILKDATIKATVCPDISLDANWQPISSITVQYIDPMQSNATGGWIQDTGDNWFGQDKLLLSVDPNNDQWDTSNSFNTKTGHGYEYWRRASNDTSDDALSPKSSGWFIDNVEAFRPYEGKIDGKTQTIDCSSGCGWNSWSTSAPCFSPATSPSLNWRPLNALGINTYEDDNDTYLGYTDTRTPTKDSNGKAIIREAAASKGGKVAPSVGIDVASGIINLSHSGVSGKDNRAPSPPYTSTTKGSYKTPASFNSLPAKHAGDELFINKLTTPGTVWRWKEDPDQIMYVTVLNTDFSTGDPYSQDEWNREQKDLDTFAGVYLFNYAMFADYLVKKHHRHTLGFGVYPVWTETWPYDKADFVSRVIPDHTTCCGNLDNPLLVAYIAGWGACGCDYGASLNPTSIALAATYISTVMCSLSYHGHDAARDWPFVNVGDEHKRFPTGIYDWNHQVNKRRRFVFKSEVYKDMNGAVKGGLLGSGDHGYLPTNDPSLPAHFDATGEVLTEYPTGVPGLAGQTLPIAPGIRNDGMHTGYDYPGGSYPWDPDGTGAIPYEEIPLLKRWSAASAPTDPAMVGSVTWEIMEPFTENDDRMASKNPAVWETEPKEDVGLDIYHEIGQIYPIELNSETIEQHVGAIGIDAKKNSFVTCWASGATLALSTPGVATALNPWPGPFPTIQDIRVIAADRDFVMLGSLNSDGIVVPLNNNHTTTASLHVTPPNLSHLVFWRADGSSTVARVGNATYTPGGLAGGTWYKLEGDDNQDGVHNHTIWLPWFNCYSFGNGVESDRIRDDYNQVTIDNGPKASTTIEEPYLEERRKNGFIWSGLYNSTSGVNNTNQFIQAEKITKDVNPSYGSIQKLFARDSDLVAFCEDRVLKVLANKDALYNADGNTNLISTDRVLGNVRPFIGDYGISLNPESFASDSYRSYFSDVSRGVILRLSQDGLTPISDVGMHDWFADNLPLYNKIIGSFDDNKGEYNITLHGQTPTTLSYCEKAKGWVSFKSWIQENGVSLNNSYYTFSGGQMFQHHINETRNEFYGTQFDSSVDVLFNQIPSSIKSFSTLNYEGSQARITPEINDNPNYYDNFPKDGWYVKEMISNAQELGEMEFWDKEDKWFSQVKGVKTEWLNDGTAGNIDPREFSYQGIGNAGNISCPECPEVTSWNCNRTGEGGFDPCSCQEEPGSEGEYSTKQDCLNNTNDCCGQPQESWDCYDGNCIDPGTGLGLYTTWSACDSACAQSPPLWVCGPIVGGGVANNCTEVLPSDPTYTSLIVGNNAFISEAQCNIACQVYGCTDPLALNYYAGASVDDGSCYYATWDCDNGVCVDNFLGTGQYSTFAACDTACVTSSADNWLCHAGGCIPTNMPVNTIAGIFATLSACQVACNY